MFLCVSVCVITKITGGKTELSEPLPSFGFFFLTNQDSITVGYRSHSCQGLKIPASGPFFSVFFSFFFNKIYSIHIRNHVQSRALWLPNIAHSHSIHEEKMHIYICSNLKWNQTFSQGLLNSLQFSLGFTMLNVLISNSFLFKLTAKNTTVSHFKVIFLVKYFFFKILHFLLFCLHVVSHLSTVNLTLLSVQRATFAPTLYSVIFYFFSWNLKLKYLLSCAFWSTQVASTFCFLHKTK